MNGDQVPQRMSDLAASSQHRLEPTADLSATADVAPAPQAACVYAKLGHEGLQKLLTRTNYRYSQEKGQRIYGPPANWQGEAPERGCEVFIGHIPRDCFEDELVPIFESVGQIYQFRLMIEYDGTNRGYGFCVYTNREDTKAAVTKLNNYEIRRGKNIGVCHSVDNCRLFVGGIPKDKTRSDIYHEMQKITDHVKDIIAYPSINDKTKNRGFAFVEYTSHKAAAMARRKLQNQQIKLWDQSIHVDWAEPEREVNEETMSKVKILYARNLMVDTTEDTLREHFVRAAGGDSHAVERVKKLSDFAFIHFRERESAERALHALNNTLLDNSLIEVTWAKPVDKSDGGKQQSLRSRGMPELQPPLDLFTHPFLQSPFGLGSSPALPGFGFPTNMNVFGTRGSTTNRNGRRNAAGSRGAGALRSAKHPIEMLDEYCFRIGLGRPHYTAQRIDISDPDTGCPTIGYVGQCTLLNPSISVTSQSIHATMEEARAAAAETALNYFLSHQSLQTYSDLLPFSLFSPPIPGTPTNPYPSIGMNLMTPPLRHNGQLTLDEANASAQQPASLLNTLPRAGQTQNTQQSAQTPPQGQAGQSFLNGKNAALSSNTFLPNFGLYQTNLLNTPQPFMGFDSLITNPFNVNVFGGLANASATDGFDSITRSGTPNSVPVATGLYDQSQLLTSLASPYTGIAGTNLVLQNSQANDTMAKHNGQICYGPMPATTSSVRSAST